MQVRLVVVAGPLTGSRFPLPSDSRTVIGRDDQVEVQLPGSRVSREHAVVVRSGERVQVEDLGSRNGTRVDLQPLEPYATTQLRNGQVIQIGPHALLVAIEGQRPDLEDAAACALDQPKVSPRYKIHRQAGSGGQGNVWLAKDRETGGKVAIKVVKARIANGSEEHRRFMLEGELACRIDCPHVVKVLDVCVPPDGEAYLVMEYVSGRSAWELLEARGPLPMLEVLRLGIHLARALVTIAGHGVVHRDVKPHNLLVSRDGRGKLGDFGIAKVLGGKALTRTGFGLGSLNYIAPEQALNAKEADGRSDLYGLGATLYTLISGRPPVLSKLSGNSAVRDMLRQLEEERPPPLSELRSNCPKALAVLVERDLLARDPDQRPSDPEEVLKRLQDLAQG